MRRLSVTIAVALLLLFPAVVSAAPLAPVTLAFDETSSDVVAFRDLQATGDMLVAAEYNIAYSTTPADSTSVNYIFRLKNGTTTLATTTPYPYTDSGYGKGVVSVYLTAAQVTAASLGAWPFSGLTLELSGNPTIFTTVPTTTLTLASGNYSTSSGQSTNQTQLNTKVLGAANLLEIAWGVDLLTDTGRINATAGAIYFTNAIPDLRLMAPDAFSVSTETPTVPTPVPTPGGAGTLAGQSETRFDGTFWLNPALDATATTLGLPVGAFAAFMVLIMIIGMAILGLKIGGNGGALIGFALAITVVVPIVGIYGGFIPPAWGLLSVALVAVVAVLKMAREWVPS
jgi:hypothetical protein